MKHFEKVFVINLKHRTDRREQVKKELKKANITEYEFFDAIKPTIEDVNKWNPQYLHKFMNRPNYRIGCLGCLLSHKGVIEKCIKENINSVLILEDDVTFLKDLETLNSYIDQLKSDFGMLYLSGTHILTISKETENIYNIQKTFTTNSYIIRRSAMKEFLKHINGYLKEVDVFYTQFIQSRFKCYVTVPHITHQGEGYSDIQEKNVKYFMRYHDRIINK